jgi:ribosomal protein L14E/L6E/L27E
MRYGDMVVVTRGPHKDRRAVCVYDTNNFHGYVYVTLKSGAGVQVNRRDVRHVKSRKKRASWVS